jgi:uncharacterized protein (TIGR03066 family)
MSALRTAVLGCVLLLGGGPLLAQGGADLVKQLRGKWEATQKVQGQDVKVQLEFLDKGKMTITVRGEYKIAGEYKVSGSSTLEVKLALGKETKEEKQEAKVSGDTLELKDPKSGKADQFKRVGK